MLRSIGVSALGLQTLTGSSVAAATGAESLRSREPTEFGTKETKVVDEVFAPEDPRAYLSTSVTGYDSFPKERDDVWFSAVSSIPLPHQDPDVGATVLDNLSIEVKPRGIPEENAPRIDSIDTYREGTQITLEDSSGDYKKKLLVFGLELLWENTVNRVSPISLPASNFGVSPFRVDIDRDLPRENIYEAFSAEWDPTSGIAFSPAVPVFTADFQLSFRAAGADGHTLQGTYSYDVTFEATFGSLFGPGFNRRTVTNNHLIRFVVGDRDDDGSSECGRTDLACPT